MTTTDTPRLPAGRTLTLGLSRIRYEVKTYFRQGDSVFFTFLFPLLFLTIFSVAFSAQSFGPPGGEITAAEWAFFLKLALPIDDLPAPPTDWLETRAWAFVLNAEAEVDGLRGLRASLAQDSAGWRSYFEDEAPQVALGAVDAMRTSMTVATTEGEQGTDMQVEAKEEAVMKEVGHPAM